MSVIWCYALESGWFALKVNGVLRDHSALFYRLPFSSSAIQSLEMHAVFETIEFIFSYSLAFSAIASPISNTEQANGTALLTKLLAWDTEDDGMSILGGRDGGWCISSCFTVPSVPHFEHFDFRMANNCWLLEFVVTSDVRHSMNFHWVVTQTI